MNEKDIDRGQFLKLFAASAFAIVVPKGFSSLQNSGSKPNIIFVLADDMGYGDLGCYGQKQIKTPNLDNMASHGMRFTNCYAGDTVCAPSRNTLMTGEHTGHCFIRGNKEYYPFGEIPLPEGTMTVPMILKKAGYHTALIGKWGLGTPDKSSPRQMGFDYFYGYLGQRQAHNYYPEFLWKNEELVPLKNVVPNMNPSGSGYAKERIQYSPNLINEEVIKYIKENKNNPFFLYYALTLPHANDEAPKDMGMEVPDYGIYKKKNWPVPEKGYAQMVTMIDKYMGEINKTLKESDIYNNTIVIFSSDNGPQEEGGNNPYYFDSNGPFRGIKRDLYEGGIREPFIVQWPEKIKKGSVSDHICAFWDFMPTACDIAGIRTPRNIDGISFLPTLLGDENHQKQHEYLYWEFSPNHNESKAEGKQAVRMGKWKAIRFISDGHVELYNLYTDIGEKNNIASQHPSVVKKLVKFMDESHSPSKLFPLKGNESAHTNASHYN